MLGNFNYSLDDKGRLVIPSKIRHQLDGELFLSLGFENTIDIRTKEQFDDWSLMLNNMSQLNKNSRNLSRAILGNTHTVKLDASGRINIPIHLQKRTPIKHEVVVVGLGNKIEIWDSKNWDTFMDQTGSGLLEEVAEEIDNSQQKLQGIK